MRRPFKDKRVIGPFLQSNSPSSSGPTIEFILSGVSDSANVIGGVEDIGATTDIANEVLFNQALKPEDVTVERQPPNTVVKIKLLRPESYNRINDLVSEMEELYELDGVIIGQ